MPSLHISLPESLKEFVKEEVDEGGYGTPSDYVRSLLREAKERKERKVRRRIDQALLASLETPAEEVTPEYLAELRREVREVIARKRPKGA